MYKKHNHLYNVNHRYNTRRKVTINRAINNIQKRFRGELIRNRILRLTKYKICSICLETLNYTNIIFLNSCDHIFHKHCIVTWLKYENNCPNCRRKITYKFNKRISKIFVFIRRLF